MTTPTDALKSQTMKFTLLSKNVLSLEEADLYELANLAGVLVDPKVFKIIVDLLKLNVAPTAIVQMLKGMRNQDKLSSSRGSNLQQNQPGTRHKRIESDAARNVQSENVQSKESRPRGQSASRNGGRS